jgi:hemoglobin
VGLSGYIREEFYSRLHLTAQHMINSPGDGELSE